jgi:hypothetical protein
MSSCNLAAQPEWMVGEMGLSEPGDLSKLSRAFEPDVAAILLVAARISSSSRPSTPSPTRRPRSWRA